MVHMLALNSLKSEICYFWYNDRRQKNVKNGRWQKNFKLNVEIIGNCSIGHQFSMLLAIIIFNQNTQFTKNQNISIIASRYK